MNICIPVTPDGACGGGWGRASRVAVARVEAGEIVDWAEHDVRWDILHDEGPEGGHHARIARFLMDNDVDTVVAGHMGPPMVNMLGKMGMTVFLDAEGDARAAVLAAASAV